MKARNEDEVTPLHSASANISDPEIISLLLSNGADAKVKTTKGITPLHSAALINTEPQITDLLLRNDADPNALDDSGWSPLRMAISNNSNPEITDLLLHNGADPNALAHDGLSPLHVAAMTFNSNPEIVDLLIQKGANINARVKGLTPLHLAIDKSLLALISSPDYDDGDDNDNNLAVVSALLESKADPNVVDNLGCPPLFYAQHYDTATELEDLLVKHGANVSNYSYLLCMLKNLPMDVLLMFATSSSLSLSAVL